MVSLNDKLKTVTLWELLVLIIVLFIIQYLLDASNIIHLDSVWIYIVVIFYFIYKLKDALDCVKEDIRNVFLIDNLKSISFVVVLNIFIAYGFLYLANFLLDIYPDLNFFLSFHVLFNSIVFSDLFVTIVVSPIFEELVFRGVFFNRFKLIVPLSFAIVASSLVFASLHSFGSIFSAFVFAISMAILYVKTDNIFIPIFAHFLNNLFAEFVVAVDVNNFLFTDSVVFAVIGVLSVISFIILIYWIVKQLNIIND